MTTQRFFGVFDRAREKFVFDGLPISCGDTINWGGGLTQTGSCGHPRVSAGHHNEWCRSFEKVKPLGMSVDEWAFGAPPRQAEGATGSDGRETFEGVRPVVR